ncbi:MAG: RimK family alpha-L-glutamate ligase [Deltaproteobacteria bacterium]|nr:RimK family alpha-L-glutamate ligase [Deltaproteobacteria bacterium]
MNSDTPPQSPPIETDQQPLIGFAALMRMGLSGIDLLPLGTRLIEHLKLHPNDANALLDLSIVLQLRRSPDIALNVQAMALEIKQLYRFPAATGQVGLQLLAIMGPGDIRANTPIEFLLENSDVALDLLYLVPGKPFPASVPDHHVLFIAVAESDQNRQLLRSIEEYLESWPRPVLNRPDRIAYMSRNKVVELLQSAPGLVIPVSTRIGRQILEQVGRAELSITAFIPDGDFPIIARPVDSHAGHGLSKLDNPESLADYLQSMPDDQFYIARFVDYRGPDGLFRKFRIALIDGRPFACHMAISEHWMIHYLNAGMTESPEKRAEEAAFMAGFDTDFATRHKAALRAIHERMGLDYLAIDCAETDTGELLIFEVDTSMVVHAMDPVDIFPYKQPQMKKLFAAFRAMLAKAAQSDTPPRLMQSSSAGEGS